MKTKTLNRIFSLMISVCMLVSLFTCLMQVSATTGDTNLFHVTASASGKRIGWRSSTKNSHLLASTKYRISLDWENISNAPFGDTVFSIYCYTDDGFKNIWDNDAYVSGWTVKSTELANGNHYDIDFTTTAKVQRELIFYFGDINKNISSMEFKTANWMVYTRDESNNLTDAEMTPTFGSPEFREASETAMNKFATTTSYSAGSNNEKFWIDYLGETFSCVFEAIPDGYFDAVGGGDPEPPCTHENKTTVEAVASTCTPPGHAESTVCDDCGEITDGSDAELPLDPNNHEGEGTKIVGAIPATEKPGYTGDTVCAGCGVKLADGEEIPAIDNKMIHFPAGEDSYQVLVYKIDGTIQAGVYAFTIDEYAKTGVKSTVNMCVNSTAYTTKVGVDSDDFDEANRKRTVKFHLWGTKNDGALILIGNYGLGENMETYYRNPQLYLLDDEGNPTGENLVRYFTPDTVELKTGYSRASAPDGKWVPLNWTADRIILENIKPTYFGEVCLHSNTSEVEEAESTCTTPGHAAYTVCDDCGEIISGDATPLPLDPDNHENEVTVPAVASTCKTQGHTAYIACSACGEILDGSNTPLDLDPNNHEGEGTEIRDAVKATDHSTGYTGDTYCLGCGAKIAEGEVTPILIRKMLHFSAGEDGWQVMVYKMSGTFEAGIYRFTIDEAAKTNVKSYVALYVNGPGYNTGVEQVADSDVLDTETNKRTVEFHLWGTKPDGALLMIGNYGNGDNMETYYANPELYLLDEEGNPTGENLIEDFLDDNIVLKTGTSRASAAVGKWTSLNWSSAKVQAQNYNPTVFGNECEHYVKEDVEAVASTCTTQGNIAHKVCKVCGAYFDSEGNELTADQVLLPLDPENHAGEGTERRDHVAATRTSNGYTGDIYCAGCGVCLEKGTIIYSGSWASKMITWGEGARGYSRVMYRPAEGAFEAGATYRYSFDMEIDEAEANEDNYWKIFYRTDTQANWTTDFTKIPLNFETDVVKTPLTHGYHYEVTFTVPADCLAEDNILITFGDRNMEGIPPLMRFANIDLWKLDGEGNATEQIIIDLPAILAEIIPTSDGFKKLCADKGEWYTVENYTDSLDLVEQNGYFAPAAGCAHEHTYAIGAIASTCTDAGRTGTVYCSDCHAIISEDTALPLADHTVGEWENDENNHWHVCSECGEKLDEAAHTYEWVVTKEATAEENGLREEICSVCGHKTGNSEEIIFDTHTAGDINGDGKVNNKDLTRLFQYLSDWDVEVEEKALDVNGDGKVNNKDLTRLFQYLSDWDVEIF